MKPTEYITEFFKLSIFDRYAIFSIMPNQVLNNDSIRELRQRLRQHYKNHPFVVIREELSDLEVDLSVYKNRSLKNLKGLAIVSSSETARERAIDEQAIFDASFAFFPELESARDWAESFFR